MRLAMTIPFLVAVISLIIWLVFSKVPSIADPWIARVAELTYFAAVLVVLLSITGKPAF
jgi:hypothetical protein